ncbi:hypothetical protein E2L08_15635 [Palleronia sediminis]|uniref:Excalibur calcium-binding domain-containing protein n=1 Tax=Palleronia sediminis TaxID=2547833 RepID=A0A4R5ZV55_9RHOB|nr:hypothetical protein [Palleronia sediminis]TDL74921.1 hypothetical protein E2L08_15635 [Palleronia sediminis]
MKTPMKFAGMGLVLAALSACGSAVPESNPDLRGGMTPIGQGVGLSYEQYEAQRLGREQALTSAPQPAISAEELRAAGLPVAQQTPGAAGLPRTDPVTGAPLDTVSPVGGVAPAPAVAPSAAPLGPSAPLGTGVVAAPAPVVPVAPGRSPSISDEQSFAAVTARETIESDAERRARQAAAYQVVPPQALPRRDGSAGPNIVQYALATTNAVGQPLYRRGGLGRESAYRRACAAFASPDLAQLEFLSQGGPERDRLGVDPDGDGFACGWNPAPFRAARG